MLNGVASRMRKKPESTGGELTNLQPSRVINKLNIYNYASRGATTTAADGAVAPGKWNNDVKTKVPRLAFER